MPRYQLFDQFDQIDLARFIYTLDEDLLEIRVERKGPKLDDDMESGARMGHKSDHIYLKTPLMQLGSFSDYKDHTYIELILIESDDAFKDFIQTIDTYHLAQIHANQKIWGFDGSVPLAYFSAHYYPLLKRSANTYQDCLVVKIDKVDTHVQFYDQDNNQIKVSDLKIDVPVRAVLDLNNLGPINKDTFETQLNLIQLKVNLK